MVNLGTREQYYEKTGKQICYEEDCPFCTHIKDQEGHIVWRGKHWFLLHNIYPYSGDDKHLMAVPYTHKKYYLELSDDEILDFKNLHKFIEDFYGEDHYFSCLRETMGNRSIEHLHYHFIPGKLQGKYLRKMLMDQGFPIKQEL